MHTCAVTLPGECLRVKGDMVLFAGNTVWSISECFRGVWVDAPYNSMYTLLLLYLLKNRTEWSVEMWKVMKSIICTRVGEHGPIIAYFKNNIKVVFHIGKDRPRPDIVVIAVSVMSTNTSTVKAFTFQAAVPKVVPTLLSISHNHCISNEYQHLFPGGPSFLLPFPPHPFPFLPGGFYISGGISPRRDA